MTSEEWQRWWQRDGAAGLRALLLEAWDPIGVRPIAAAHDEYDAYVRGLGPRLRKGADAAAVAAYLSWAQDRMGLPRPAEELREVAERVTAWYAQATAQRSR